MRTRRIAIALGAAALLGGCASHPSSIRAGEAIADVLSRVGAPAVTAPRADGQRLLFATAPMGQQAYLVDVDRVGRVAAVTDALTDGRFAAIRIGDWDQARVRQEFGPPAETIWLSLKHHHVWSYRYRQQGTWNSLMHVHFDADGIVRDVYPGPDPLFDRDGRLFRLRGVLR